MAGDVPATPETIPRRRVSVRLETHDSGRKSGLNATRPLQAWRFHRISRRAAPDADGQWGRRGAGRGTGCEVTRGRTGFDRMARGSDCVSWLVGWPR